MENFIVSARKYRPAIFESVIGQSSITTTLKNSIKNNHLAQAYLFCGPRGVGKTTCARIYAKTINCFNITDKTEACNECESCQAFNRSTSYNIHELDAASNNSVEDIRNLIDQVRIPPQIGNYSIYIIDEVHMLSSQAFNAFLKTLEEPPAHAIFILATTEKHKIIPTILSRCQIFDFNRIKIDDIVKYLNYVSDSEGVDLDPGGATIIAQKADGAMRDALSIFDQIVSFAGSNIGYKDVIDNLNVLDYDYYFNLTNSFLQSNIAEALLTYNKILDEGFDSHYFIAGLSTHFRDLLVCKDESTLQLLEVGASIRDNYQTQARTCSDKFLFDALRITNNCDMTFKSSMNKRLHVELSLLQLCNILNETVNVAEIKKPLPSVKKIDTEPKKTESVAKEEKTKSEAKAMPARGQEEAKNEPVKTIKEKPVPDEPEKVHQSPSKSFKSTVSIKDTLKGKTDAPVKSKEDENKASEKPVEDSGVQDETDKVNEFTEKDLHGSWLEFAESISSETRIYNTLTNNLPALKENFKVEFALNNEGQVNSLKNIKGKLLVHLKNKLVNSKIDLDFVVTKQKDAKKKIYTDSDKLSYLKEQNPNVSKLQKSLNLDFGNV